MEKLIICPTLLIIWLTGYMFEEFIPLVLLAIILVSMRLVILYRNVQPVFIFYIFHLSYILILIPYFMFGIQIAGQTEFQIPLYMNMTLLIHGAFIIALYTFTDLNLPDRRIVFSGNLVKRDNKAVFLLLTGGMVAILLNMLLSEANVYLLPADQVYGAYVQNIEKASGAPEYFPVFFLAAFIFAKKLYKRCILIGIFFVYSYLALTRGMRVSLLMVSLLFFALFLDGKIKTRYLLWLAVAGLVLIQAAGNLRDGSRDIAEVFSISRGGQIMTNQSEVFYTSNVVVSSVVDGICGLKERAFSLFAASLQTVFPHYVGWRNESLPLLYVRTLSEREAGGGCLISVSFYFWMDYLGVVLIAFFIARVTRRAIRKPTPLLAIYIICVYSLYPRWLTYNPVNFLFRLPLYAIILYLFLMEFHRMMLKRKSTKDIAQERKTLPRAIL